MTFRACARAQDSGSASMALVAVETVATMDGARWQARVQRVRRACSRRPMRREAAAQTLGFAASPSSVFCLPCSPTEASNWDVGGNRIRMRARIYR